MIATLESIESKCNHLLDSIDDVKQELTAINSRVRETEIEQGRQDERLKQAEVNLDRQGTWDKLLGVGTLALFALASALGIDR